MFGLGLGAKTDLQLIETVFPGLTGDTKHCLRKMRWKVRADAFGSLRLDACRTISARCCKAIENQTRKYALLSVTKPAVET